MWRALAHVTLTGPMRQQDALQARQEETLARIADAACFALSRAAPILSARRRLWFGQALVLALCLAGLGYAAWRHPLHTAAIAHAVGYAAFSALTVWRLFAAAAALAPQSASNFRWSGDLPVYTVLCPLYREAHMLAPLGARLARLDYPADKLDVKIVLEADDTQTIAAANAFAWPAHVEVIVVPAGKPRTKPKALNFALTFARGAFVTVYDAEDAPALGQLRAALDAFAKGGEDLGCVQAPLLIDNPRASWLSGQFAAEYAIQFNEMLPLLSRLGHPLLLGGTSNHFRTHALTSAGGWDPFNVTEDADIGYRLARDGWKSAMIAPPTYEEAPVRLWQWLRQRTRWIKGHIQTWAVLMRDPARTAREMGWRNFASMQIMLAGSILASFAHGPVFVTIGAALALDTFDLAWNDWALALSGYSVAAYCAAAAAVKLGDWRIAAAALTMPLYWPLSTIAAAMALIELVARPHYWAKTEHGVTPRGGKGHA